MPDVTALRGRSDEEILGAVPNGPVVTLRDIQATYGGLYTLATAGADEYAQYYTPGATRDLVEESDQSLITIYVDVAEESDLSVEKLEIGELKDEHVEKLAHSYDSNRGPGIDPSITHKTGANPTNIGKFVIDRLARWPTYDVVQEVAANHSDGWIIERLSELGDDEQMEALQAEAEERLRGDEQAVITVRIRLEAGGEFLWPADNRLAVLKEAMKQWRINKLKSRNEADDARGYGADYVENREQEVFGTSDDPLLFWTSRQNEKFWKFDANNSWRNQPISADTALLIGHSKAFIDNCYWPAFDARAYYLPYFPGEPTAEKLERLYVILARLQQDYQDAADAENAEFPARSPLVRAHNIADDLDEELRFHSLVIHRKDVLENRVFSEASMETSIWPLELANQHKAVLTSAEFGFDEAPFNVAAVYDRESDDADPDDDTDPRAGLELIDDELPIKRFTDLITTGPYFRWAFAEPKTNSDDPSIDDHRINALANTLRGEPIRVDTLLEQYAQRIVDETRGEHGFSSVTVMKQWAQIRALARTGLLYGQYDHERELLTPLREMTDNVDTTDEPTEDTPGEPAEENEEIPQRDIREGELLEFIEQHPALSEDNPERRTGFLLGAAVGALSQFQRRDPNGPRTTLKEIHSVDTITKNTVKTVTSNIIEKNTVYSSRDQYPNILYPEVFNLLRDSILEKDVSEWTITVSDLRFHYALGLTYGLENY